MTWCDGVLNFSGVNIGSISRRLRILENERANYFRKRKVMSFTFTVMILSQLQKSIRLRLSQNQINHILRVCISLAYGSLRLTGSAIMHFVQIFTSREKYSCWCNASNELYRMIKNRINRRLSTMKNLVYLNNATDSYWRLMLRKSDLYFSHFAEPALHIYT